MCVCACMCVCILVTDLAQDFLGVLGPPYRVQSWQSNILIYDFNKIQNFVSPPNSPAVVT